MSAHSSVPALKSALTPWGHSNALVGRDMLYKMITPLVKVRMIKQQILQWTSA